jgi:hypothetical protein
MSHDFVPLHSGAASGGANSFRLHLIPGGRSAGSFSALGPAPAPETDAGEHAVAVDLQREGDRVTGARIRCACGRVIELAFSF